MSESLTTRLRHPLCAAGPYGRYRSRAGDAVGCPCSAGRAAYAQASREGGPAAQELLCRSSRCGDGPRALVLCTRLLFCFTKVEFVLEQGGLFFSHLLIIVFVMNLQSRASEELSSTAAGGCEQENDNNSQQKTGLRVNAAAPLRWKSSVRPMAWVGLFFSL